MWRTGGVLTLPQPNYSSSLNSEPNHSKLCFLSPWHRSTYSGRFLRAVCTTSKLPLPMQYMNVGRKSVARLQWWKTKQKIYFDDLKKKANKITIGRCSLAENLRRVVLHAAQGQTESHVPTQLLRGGHESLKVVLQNSDRQTDGGGGGEWVSGDYSRTRSVCVWLTMKYWIISGHLRDFSSTSDKTSSTSTDNRSTFNYSYRLFNIVLMSGTNPPQPPLWKSSSGIWSCQQVPVGRRPRCWPEPENQWSSHLGEKSRWAEHTSSSASSAQYKVCLQYQDKLFWGLIDWLDIADRSYHFVLKSKINNTSSVGLCASDAATLVKKKKVLPGNCFGIEK